MLILVLVGVDITTRMSAGGREAYTKMEPYKGTSTWAGVMRIAVRCHRDSWITKQDQLIPAAGWDMVRFDYGGRTSTSSEMYHLSPG